MPAETEQPAFARARGESFAAAGAFVAFRDMGPGRSTTKVAQKTGKSIALIQRWCRKHRWIERARAWDDRLDEVRRRAAVQAVEAMAARHVGIACMVQEKVVDKLNRLTDEDIDQMSLTQLVRLYAVAVKIERQARGVPDVVTKSQTHATQTGPASPRPIEGIGTIITTRTQALGVAAHPEANVSTG
jgi:hypothetical protein